MGNHITHNLGEYIQNLTVSRNKKEILNKLSNFETFSEFESYV